MGSALDSTCVGKDGALVLAQSSSAADLGGFGAWAVSVIEALGGFGAALLIALESFFPPIPSELILPLAGFTASKGPLGLVEVILWCTAGSLAGAWALYAVGALLGRKRTHRLLDRLPLVKLEDVEKAEDWFGKHAKSSVFFGRMVPVVRSLVSIPAGMTKMAPVLFTLLTAGGSLLWNGGLILAGYLLGENWQAVRPYVGGFSNLILVAAGIMVTVWAVKRIRANRSTGSSSGSSASDSG